MPRGVVTSEPWLYYPLGAVGEVRPCRRREDARPPPPSSGPQWMVSSGVLFFTNLFIGGERDVKRTASLR